MTDRPSETVQNTQDFSTPQVDKEAAEFLRTVSNFVVADHISAVGDESIPEMEKALEKARVYSYRIGTMVNEAQRKYNISYNFHRNRLLSMEEETETTRKAKLNAATANEKWYLDNLKTLKSHLRMTIMSLMQAIKTRRSENV
jgi:hypothetical protein